MFCTLMLICPLSCQKISNLQYYILIICSPRQVAICAGCNVIRPWGAAVVGVVAGMFYTLVSWAMVKCQIDDPLDAVAGQ